MTSVMSKVALLEHMGSDLTVVNAARVSYGKKKEALDEKDEKLIQYLAKHGHWTPFGHCMAQFHIKAPIFVARQLVKHQVGLVWNEISRRYVDDRVETFSPKEWRGRPGEGKSKQGSSGTIEDPVCAFDVYWDATKHAKAVYEKLLALGVAPEQARIVLPVSTYTEWYWTGSLAAWARVCNLRIKADVQLETREVAQDIAIQMEQVFPISWRALRGQSTP